MAETNDEAPSASPEATRRLGGRLYFLAAVIAQVSALVRYVVMARILGPEQLGMAATLVVTSSFFDLVTDMGGDRFLIQDRDGDDPAVQGLVQFVNVGRGTLIGLVMMIFASSLAAFYKSPGLAVGFVALGFAPLIGGFAHLDFRRIQRRSDFRPEAWCMIVSEVSCLAATAMAAWVTRSFTAIIWGLVARALAMTVLSQLLSRRRYRLGWSSKNAPRFWHFAAPLMLNGFMLFVGSQGDRVMVARQLGAAIMGEYQAVILLILYPAALLQRYMHALFLPLVANARDDPARRKQVVEMLGGMTFLLAIAMAAGFALVAPLVVPLLYGRRFSATVLVAGLLGVLQTIRFLMNWPTTVNLALGQSRAVLASSMAKLLVFPAAYAGFKLAGGIPGVVTGFIAGELISIFVGVALMDRNLRRNWFFGFDRLAYFALASATIIASGLAIEWRSQSLSLILTTFAAVLVSWILTREASTIAAVVKAARHASRPWLVKFRAVA